MKQETIARIAHEINRAYCASVGDNTQPAWEDAEDWQKQSVLNGVAMHLDNPDATPEESHQSWLDQKIAEGWTYGEVKDPEAKQHPCCLPYDELAQEQKSKDYLFKAVVNVLKDIPDEEELKASILTTANDEIKRVATPAQRPESTLVKYIGNKPVWNDRIYKTGLSFTPGQIRQLPNALAVKLLRHVDIFAKEEHQPDCPAVDDTQYQLDQGTQQVQKKEKRQIEMDIIDQVRSMNDKEALVDFASSRLQLNLPRTMKAETMQNKIAEHIYQFGIVS